MGNEWIANLILGKEIKYQMKRYETSQQIKKDGNLMGFSSGDTNVVRGSKNHLKDCQKDNQSADKDLLTNPTLDVVSRIDGGRLCSKCPELIKRYGYCQVKEDWVRPQLNVFSWDWRSNK